MEIDQQRGNANKLAGRLLNRLNQNMDIALAEIQGGAKEDVYKRQCLNCFRRMRVLFMRVIAGSAKRIQLKTLDGLDTRPTTDRIKETLFNMIAPTIYDSVFLDLFGGSGGIGIEALSRGAREAVFVENNPKAMACICLLYTS